MAATEHSDLTVPCPICTEVRPLVGPERLGLHILHGHPRSPEAIGLRRGLGIELFPPASHASHDQYIPTMAGVLAARQKAGS